MIQLRRRKNKEILKNDLAEVSVETKLSLVAWVCFSATAFILSLSLSLSLLLFLFFFFQAVAQRSTWLERRYCSSPPCVFFFCSAEGAPGWRAGGGATTSTIDYPPPQPHPSTPPSMLSFLSFLTLLQMCPMAEQHSPGIQEALLLMRAVV